MIVYFLLGKIFALLIGVYYFKSLSPPFKLILLLVFIAGFCECYGSYISHFLHKSNAWLFNIYMIIEVWIMGVAAMGFVNNRKLKIFYVLLLLINTIFWVINIKSSLYIFASSSMILGCILLTFIYIIVLFNNSLFVTKNIMTQPVFWLSISTILYFGCDIPYMGLHNFLSDQMPKLAGRLVNINDVLDIIRYPIVGISFLLIGLNKPSRIKLAES